MTASRFPTPSSPAPASPPPQAADLAAARRTENAVAAGLVLFFLTLIVYLPAMTAGFIWDDDQLLTQSATIKDPAGWWKFWFAPETTDYFPLTFTTLWVEWRLWGMNASGYHITNILLHGLVSMLTWRVLARLRVPAAWLAAAIFAVHPVCVESVAWISERKNTLSQLFYLLSLLAYLRFEENGRRRTYLASFGACCAALLAKTSVVVLPLVLLLCAWWRRGRITRSDLLRTAPFFAAAFVLGIVTIYFQYGRAIGEEVIPIGNPLQRFVSACFAAGFYVYSALLPVNVMTIYPEWHRALPWWQQLVPGVILAGILAWAWRRRTAAPGRAALFGLGYFLIGLLPVLGFLKMSYMRLTLVADHFQYLSLVGVVALAVAAGWRFLPPIVFRGLGVAILAAFSFLTWQHASIYRSPETLWRATLGKNPDTWQGHNHFGAVVYLQGDYAAAHTHFARAVELKPDNPEVHSNLGLTLMLFGRLDEAIREFQTAVKIRDEPRMRLYLANALAQANRDEEALEGFARSIQSDPKSAQAYLDLGTFYRKRGKLDEAAANFQKALELAPELELAHRGLERVRRLKQNLREPPAR